MRNFKMFHLFIIGISICCSIAEAKVISGRFAVVDAVSDPFMETHGGSLALTDQPFEAGEITLLPEMPYCVSVRARGKGSIEIIPKLRSGKTAPSVVFQLDSADFAYAAKYFSLKDVTSPAVCDLQILGRGDELTLDELHITPKSSVVPNGGFEEYFLDSEKVEIPENEKPPFVSPARSWFIEGGDLTAIRKENAGHGESMGLSIEGGPGTIQLTGLQIPAEASWKEALLGIWFKGPAQADLRLELQCLPGGISRVSGKTSGSGEWQYLQVKLDEIDSQTKRMHVRINIEKQDAQPLVIDEIYLTPLTPSKPEARLFVNQCGYESGQGGRFVAAVSTFPNDPVTYVLKSDDGSERAKGVLSGQGRIHEGRVDDWGWCFWEGSLPEDLSPGAYTLEVAAGGLQLQRKISIEQNAVTDGTLQKGIEFFWYQRCGMEIPGFHKACHLDDGKLPDGSYYEGWGGWHDAGDYNKYLHGGAHTGTAAFALAYTAHEGPKFLNKLDRDSDGVSDVLDEAVWGADFLGRMLDQESGGMHNSISTGYTFFGAPELETDNIRGNDDDRPIHAGIGYQQLAIACWAILAKELPDHSERYLSLARRHWDFANAHGGGGDLYAIDALYLHQAIGGDDIYAALTKQIRSLLNGQIKEGRWKGGFGNPKSPNTALVGMGTTPSVLALFALKYPEDPLAAEIKAALKEYLNFSEAVSQNVFGITGYFLGEDLSYFHPRGGWAVGNNSQYLSQAWAAYLGHQLVPDPRWLRYANAQLDWVLGMNPQDVCLMEGVGEVNLPVYHHRYFMIKNNPRGAVPGAVVNGIAAEDMFHDKPFVDWDSFPLADYECNEPWLPHNAYYIMALTAMPYAE